MKTKLKFLSGPVRGLYIYQRLVPHRHRETLKRKVWHTSIGRDYNAAVFRCIDLTREHDELIQQLDAEDPRSVQLSDTLGRLGKRMAVPPNIPARVENRGEQHWRDTERTMALARVRPPRLEWERLVSWAVVAFGDTQQAEIAKVGGALEGVNLSSNTARPADAVQAALWDANKATLNARISELSPHATPNDPTRLSALLERYIVARTVAFETASGYRKKVGAFVKEKGDLRAADVTSAILRDYRDVIATRMTPTSVAGYFNPLKAILRYAVEEEIIEVSPAAKVKLPKDPLGIEERKSLPFSLLEARLVMEEAARRWADDAPSRVSPQRRKLYRLTVGALLYTGARPHELWRLRPEDVGGRNDVGWPEPAIDICRTKSGARLIPMPEAVQEFAQFVSEGGLNCLSDDGNGPADEATIAQRINGFSDKQFNPLLRDLQLKRARVSLYSTRSTFVTALQRLRVPDGIIRDIIGHKDVTMLRHYKSREEMKKMLRAMTRVKYE